MKKLFTALTLMLILGTMAACGSKETDSKEKVNNKESESTAERVTPKESTPTTTFENGTLETDDFSLTIYKTEIIQSPSEDRPGLFVTFKLTNKTKDQDVIPNETLVNFRVQQESDTSRIDLMDNYFFLDAFGDEDDIETYNKMVDLDNASADALLPGKSIEFVDAYELDNDQNDVTFIGIDQDTFAEVGKHTVKLQ